MEKFDLKLRRLFFQTQHWQISYPEEQLGFKTTYFINGRWFTDIQYVMVLQDNDLVDTSVFLRTAHMDIYSQRGMLTYTTQLGFDDSGTLRYGKTCLPATPYTGASTVCGLFHFLSEDRNFRVCLETVLRLHEIDGTDTTYLEDVYHLARLTNCLISPYIFLFLLRTRDVFL
jgi:hypothetical protein